jgi:hypothetical protein
MPHPWKLQMHVLGLSIGRVWRDDHLLRRSFLPGRSSGCPCVYDVPKSRESGVHLSTVPLQNGYLIYYVGETGVSFRARLRQTHSKYVAAMYQVYSPTEFARGEKVPLWPGYWGMSMAQTASPKRTSLVSRCRCETSSKNHS